MSPTSIFPLSIYIYSEPSHFPLSIDSLLPNPIRLLWQKWNREHQAQCNQNFEDPNEISPENLVRNTECENGSEECRYESARSACDSESDTVEGAEGL